VRLIVSEMCGPTRVVEIAPSTIEWREERITILSALVLTPQEETAYEPKRDVGVCQRRRA
jgi:hypothetical protein